MSSEISAPKGTSLPVNRPILQVGAQKVEAREGAFPRWPRSSESARSTMVSPVPTISTVLLWEFLEERLLSTAVPQEGRVLI